MEKICHLLSSCVKNRVASYPKSTHSGNRECLETDLLESSSDKRIPCRPSCQAHAPFCHGRCVFGGRGCFFHPCSKRPFRESSSATCTQLALTASIEDCKEYCVPSQIDTNNGAATCQHCVEKNLPDVCSDLSASSCWHCLRPIMTDIMLCELSNSYNDQVGVLTCVRDLTTSRCGSCICNLVCYFMDPLSKFCRACQENEEVSHLFLHHGKCPHGYTFAEDDSKCYKTFQMEETWAAAKVKCETNGGHLAQPITQSSVFAVIESINLQGIEDECWIGGKEKLGSFFLWVEGNYTVTLNNWADRFPSNKSDFSTCMHQTGSDGYWRTDMKRIAIKIDMIKYLYLIYYMYKPSFHFC